MNYEPTVAEVAWWPARPTTVGSGTTHVEREVFVSNEIPLQQAMEEDADYMALDTGEARWE